MNNEQYMQLLILTRTLVALCLQKGVFTGDEWEKAHAQVSSGADQEFAELTAEAIAELSESQRNLCKILGLI